MIMVIITIAIAGIIAIDTIQQTKNK